MGHLWIANSITDLIEGDVREHIPLERIPLAGDVLGMGTTTSYDNGELAFLHDRAGGRSRVYKAQPEAGGVEELIPGEGLHPKAMAGVSMPPSSTFGLGMVR